MSRNMKKSKKSAEQHACESLARNQKTWIIYDPKEPLDEWLEANAPSKAFLSDDVSWVTMTPMEYEKTVNYDNLEEQWRDLKSSGEPVNYYSVCQLASTNGLLGGSWMSHVDSAIKADIIWEKMAREYADGALAQLASSCGITHYEAESENQRDSYIVYIGNSNFTNREQVYKLETAIRQAGLKSRLMYKPSIYTYLGIYRNNDFNIRPSIYSSEYDILERKSTVTALYEQSAATAVVNETKSETVAAVVDETNSETDITE